VIADGGKGGAFDGSPNRNNDFMSGLSDGDDDSDDAVAVGADTGAGTASVGGGAMTGAGRGTAVTPAVAARVIPG
jgi:hypothetical protein